jgi:LysM repeat protein
MFSFLSTQTSIAESPVIEEKKSQNSVSCSERIREGEMKISDLKSLANTSSNIVVIPKVLQTNGKGLFDPSKSYKFRLTSDTAAVSASSSDTATAKVSYDPSGSTEFSALAGLFGLYKVNRVRVHLWPTTPGDPAVSVPLKVWIIAADPSMLVSGTPTAQTTASLAHVERLTGHQTTSGVCHQFLPSCKSSLVANLAPTRDGYILCTVAWPGQWVSFSKTFGSTSLSHFTYQVDYEVEFKSRG